MSALDSLSSTYAEAVATSLPLHRAFIVISGTICSLAINNKTHKSVAETLINIKIADLSYAKSALIAGATLTNILAGIFLALFSLALAHVLLKSCLALAARATNLENRANLQAVSNNLQSLTTAEKQAEAGLLENTLLGPRKVLKSYNLKLELLSASTVMFLVSSIWGNVLDLVICGLSFVSAAAVSVFAAEYFIAEYFGPAAVKAELEGRRIRVSAEL